MKTLLRKLFFWDEPAKGAFLHATLALAIPWSLSALLSWLTPLALMQKPGTDVIHGILWPYLAMFFGMPLAAAVETIAMIICLGRLSALRSGNQQAASPREKITFCLGGLAAACCLSALFVLVMAGEYWTARIVPAFTLILTGYGLFGYCLTRRHKGIIGKGVLRTWMSVAALWLVSAALAFATKNAAEHNRAAVEQRFGRKTTREARDQWIAQDCVIDAAFWQKAQKLLQKRPKPNGDFDSSETLVYDILSVDPSRGLSPDELDCYRKQLEDFVDLPVLEAMFSGAVPCTQMEDFVNYDAVMTMADFADLEQWRLHFALADKKMDVVEAVLGRMTNLLECWMEMQKHGFLEISWSMPKRYFRQMEAVLESSLATDELLCRLKMNLQKSEAEYSAVLDGMTFSKAVFYNHQLQAHDGAYWAGEAVPRIYPLFYFLRTLDGNIKEKPAWQRRLQINVGRFLFPQFWFLASNEKRIVFKSLGMDPQEIPEYSCGSIMVAMYYELWEWPLYDFHRVLAKSRALQCMIDAVLEYRQTGEYPVSLASPLQDPFTGAPLKYRVGECWVYDYDKQEASKIQAVQIWSCGPNQQDDDGVGFQLPDDAQQKIYSRDDICVMLPLSPEE